MKNILTSVVIPTFNRKETVVEAIQSTLAQSPRNYEVLVVDDGSTDGTAKYLKSLKLPIKVIKTTNGGPAHARNVGIRAARGEYIAFLDADDLWLPDKLKQQTAYLTDHPEVQAVYTDESISEDGEITQRRFETAPPLAKNRYPAFVEYVPIHLSTLMVRQEVFETVGLFDERLWIHEDSEWFNRFSETEEFGFIEKPLVIFRFAYRRPQSLIKREKMFFVEQGELYLDIYCARRAGRKLTVKEAWAIAESRKKIEELRQQVKG